MARIWTNSRCMFKIDEHGGVYSLYASGLGDDDPWEYLYDSTFEWGLISDIQDGTTGYTPWDRLQGNPNIKTIQFPEYGYWNEE